jgi:CelD/BcsL family acetyltransferase involved in cellulose biosynthesis
VISDVEQVEKSRASSTASSTAGYVLQKICSSEDLDQVGPDWSTLAGAAASTSIFLTWEWCSTWWRHFGDNFGLWVVAVWDAHGELAGLAPLMVARDAVGAFEVRRLTFLSNGVASPDHMDILTRPGEEQQVAAAVLDYLFEHDREWDVLDLTSQAEGSLIFSALIQRGESYVESVRKQVCPYILLPDDWEEYLKTQLSQKRRHRVRKYSQRFESEFPGQVNYTFVDNQDELDRAFQFITQMSRAYWESKGHTSSFHDGRFEAFQKDIADKALKRGWLRLCQLIVKGEIVAVEYNFRFGDVIYGYQGVFDRKWAEFSPGLVLLAHAFQSAIAEDVSEFDFLRGDEEYKFYWTDRKRLESRVMHAHNLRGRVWLAAISSLERSMLWAKQRMSKGMQKKANRLISALQRRKQPVVD